MDQGEVMDAAASEQEESVGPRPSASNALPFSSFPLSSRDTTEWLLLAVLACLAVLPGVLPGRTLGHLPLARDEMLRPRWLDTPILLQARERHATQHVPWTQFAASRLREGDVPLWNPYAQLGAPFLGNGRTAFFYPTILLHMSLPARWAWALDAVVHLLTAGLGAWWLTRRLLTSSPHHPITPSPPLLAAVAYMLAVAHVSSISPLQANVAVLLPWTLLVTERLIERTTPARILVASLIFALQFFGGHAPASSALLLSCLLLLLLRIIWPSERCPSGLAALRALPALFIAAAAGFLLSGVQWLPHIYNATGAYINEANQLVLGPPAPHATAWWVGLIPLLLGGVFLFLAPDRKRTPLIVLFVICAVLSQLPIAERLLQRSPYRGVRLISTTATGPTAALMLAVLSAFGLRDLRTRLTDHAQPATLLRSLLPAASLAAVAALAFLLIFAFRHEIALLPAALGPLLAAALLIILVWRFGRRHNHDAARSPWPWIALTALEFLAFSIPRHLGGQNHAGALLAELQRRASPAARPVARFTAPGDMLPPEISTAFGVADLRGSAAITTARAQRFLEMARQTKGATATTQPAAHAAALACLVAAPDASPPAPWQPVGAAPTTQPSTRAAAGPLLFENPQAMPWFWIAPIARQSASANEALTALGAAGFDPRRVVLTDAAVAPEFEEYEKEADKLVRQPGSAGLRLRSTPQVTILEHAPDVLRLNITNPAGWLVISDAYAPGWIATLSAPDQRQNRQGGGKTVVVQKAALIAPAFGVFRAVPLASVGNAPTVTVTVRYLPKGYQHGLLMSAGGVVLLIILAVWPFFGATSREPDHLRASPTGTSP
jgi:hypothetical protein